MYNWIPSFIKSAKYVWISFIIKKELPCEAYFRDNSICIYNFSLQEYINIYSASKI